MDERKTPEEGEPPTHPRNSVGRPVRGDDFFGRELRNLAEDCGTTPDSSALDQAWAELLEPAHRGQFDYWRQRLFEQLGSVRAGHAMEILRQAARPDDGVTRSTLSLVLTDALPDAAEREDCLSFSLGVLRNDGYLVEVDGRFLFRSPLLRDWWRRFHVR